MHINVSDSTELVYRELVETEGLSKEQVDAALDDVLGDQIDDLYDNRQTHAARAQAQRQRQQQAQQRQGPPGGFEAPDDAANGEGDSESGD